MLRWLCFFTFLLTGLGEAVFTVFLFLASGVPEVFLLAAPAILLSLFAAGFAHGKKPLPGLAVSLLLLAYPMLLVRQHLLLFEDAHWLLPAPVIGLLYFAHLLARKEA